MLRLVLVNGSKFLRIDQVLLNCVSRKSVITEILLYQTQRILVDVGLWKMWKNFVYALIAKSLGTPMLWKSCGKTECFLSSIYTYQAIYLFYKAFL